MSWFKKLLSPSPKKEQPATEQPQLVAGADDNNNGQQGGDEVPHGEAPATCQIEAKQKFPFQKKKMIVASVGADGKPVYTQGQIETAMKKLSDRKKARKKAREEEKQYVEFRKQEILAQFRPSVGALRSGDEAFPKRRRGMGYGERKAFYLSIRPNPKYAVWVGKKKEKVRQAKIITPLPQATDHGITDHSALPPAEQSRRDTEREPDSQLKGKDEQKPSAPKTEDGQTKTEEPKSVTDKSSADRDKSSSKSGKSKKHHEKKKKKEKQNKNEKHTPKGNNAANPIINGVPFWMTANAADQDEMTDDDLPIDMEILEKVWNGDITLPQRPHKKEQFNSFGPIKRMKIDDKLFVRDTILFANTVESVLALQPDNDVRPKASAAMPRLITWFNKISVTTFEPANRLPREKREPVVEPLKDLKRERKGK